MDIRIGDDRVSNAGQAAQDIALGPDPDALTVLRAIWAADGQDTATLDDDCGPTKTCRNMREVTFDGFGEPGEDVAASWQATLARDGKLHPGVGTVRDLVFGPQAD
jgi:hypothetical protein